MNEPAAPTEAQRKRSWLAYAPLAFFAALTLLFLSQLFFGNPTKLPSALIGKPAELEGRKATRVALKLNNGDIFFGPFKVGQAPSLF